MNIIIILLKLVNNSLDDNTLIYGLIIGAAGVLSYSCKKPYFWNRKSYLDQGVQTDVQTKVETEVQTDVLTKVQTEVQTDVLTKVQTEVQTDVQSKVETEVQTDVQSKVETEVQTEAEEIFYDFDNHSQRIWDNVSSLDSLSPLSTDNVKLLDSLSPLSTDNVKLLDSLTPLSTTSTLFSSDSDSDVGTLSSSSTTSTLNQLKWDVESKSIPTTSTESIPTTSTESIPTTSTESIPTTSTEWIPINNIPVKRPELMNYSDYIDKKVEELNAADPFAEKPWTNENLAKVIDEIISGYF
jgi:hypothetical protein